VHGAGVHGAGVHGAAHKAVGERRLSHRGAAQCMLARLEWFGRLPVRQVVFSSPFACAMETALHMAGRLEEAVSLEASAQASAHTPREEMSAGQGQLKSSQGPLKEGGARTAAKVPVAPRAPLSVCTELGPDEPLSVCATLVAQKAAQHQVEDPRFITPVKTSPPLRALLDADGGESAFGRYAEAACEALASSLRHAVKQHSKATGKREAATYISVFGHSGYVDALAYAIAAASGMRAADLDKMLNLAPGDAEGVLVPLYADGREAVHLKRPI